MCNNHKKELKIFQAIQKSFANLGYYRPKSLENFQRFNSRNLLLLSIFVMGSILSVIFLFYEAKTILEYSQTIYSLATSLGMLFVFGNFLFKIKKVNELIVNFEKIIKKRSEHPESKAIYDFVNKMIEKWSPIFHFVITKLTPITIVLPNLITVLVAHFTKDGVDIDSDIYCMSFPIWVPYNWKAFPIGYLSTFCIQYVYVSFNMQIVSCMSYCFFTASAVMVMTIIADIKQDLQAQHENLKYNKNPTETFQKFYENIQMQSTAKEVLNGFTNIYEYITTSAFLWGLVSICGSLLICGSLDTETIRMDTILDNTTKVSYAFVSMFLVCELGEQISTRFVDINDVIYQMDWYLFPMKLQRRMPLILQASQKPVGLRGFGNFAVSRETFKKICNSGFSYFMIFRNFK